MSGTLGTVVDTVDSIIDALRAAAGRQPLPPRLGKLEFERPPMARVAVGLRIETRRTSNAFLRITQGDHILFEGPPPRAGLVTVVPLTREPMHLHLTLEGRDPVARHGRVVTETICEPLPNHPPIERFDAPASVGLGENIPCAWSAPKAERARLAVVEDNNVADHIGPATGQILLPAPARPGRVLLRLTVENDFGQSTAMRTVEVAAPRLGLTLLRPAIQYGEPGQKLTFEWRAFAADSVWLIAPDCTEPQRLHNKDGGFVFVTLGFELAEFQLIACGYGRAEQSAVLRAVPHVFAGFEPD